MNTFTPLIASELKLSERSVENTLQLLEEGCTIPFIARYRKEKTGGLDEVQIAAISDRNEKLKEVAKRKETIIKTITEQEKMTAELKERIATAGTVRSWRISTCPTNPNDAPVHRWHANRDWNPWRIS